ncbi:hydroxyacylglutathione hydrolase [Haemophilus paracuniculus]|uniref:Hydroxyacylglutathione hydrolase n=1 Tax=Haemophilus paracuniculus TaxID=734 RepID=A0A1T0AU54_9PAST|nr:hydroxyacylglutathione hydrolase [Haemophilus paracuniculus]OOS00295.1 hydroxyacylglutathione hydrolase [Haemophilus paracuniculus]
MLKITPIPARSDNYIWLIEQGSQAMVVDPSLAEPVLNALAEKSLDLTAILLTHNHADHTDGVAEIVANYPNLLIYGSSEVAEFANHIVQKGTTFAWLDHQIEVLKTAGHTAEHISYLVDERYLFCGDALFSAGCGRVFTGDYQAQFDALQQFNALTDEVVAFPAHEYTLSNLKFAQAVLPDNRQVAEHLQQVEQLRSQNLPTLPTTIGLEKQINPFLQAVSLDEFIALRQHKDRF